MLNPTPITIISIGFFYDCSSASCRRLTVPRQCTPNAQPDGENGPGPPPPAGVAAVALPHVGRAGVQAPEAVPPCGSAVAPCELRRREIHYPGELQTACLQPAARSGHATAAGAMHRLQASAQSLAGPQAVFPCICHALNYSGVCRPLSPEFT